MTKNIIEELLKNQSGMLMNESRLESWSAKDAMIKPILLYPKSNTKEILDKLKKEEINTCIVVSKKQKFLGVISDNDIIKLFLQQVKFDPLVRLFNRGYRREFIYKTAENLMSISNVVVESNTPLNIVLEKIWKENCQYLPVIDKKEKVIGVVTPSSIINLLKDY